MIRQEGSTFAARAVAGFALANPSIIRWVENGVIARAPLRADAPLFVIGGGSGHYPAFTGYVGEGVAAAAVHGDIFASPSEAAIVGVVQAARPSGEVIFGYGNYAGDRINFGAAADRLRALGYGVHQLIVTDDVASSPTHSDRRGIAGDVIVFKVCGAAIAAGLSTEAAMAAALRANASTRTLGVAFSGCTIPGATRPLFSVDGDTVAIGLGIHGEPGIENRSSLDERQLAELLVDRTVAELLPGASRRAAVLLNGMGAVNSEALYALWPLVRNRLRWHGFVAVAPLVGAYVSSLDMAGLSLSVCALDAELEAFWLAPARTVALDWRAGDLALTEDIAVADERSSEASPTGLVGAVLRDVVAALAAAEAELGELDAVAGDGDHGRGMLAGARAALAAASPISDPQASLRAAGEAWAAKAGGTSGALWGAMLVAASEALGVSRPDGRNIRAAVVAARDELARRGGARPGDKTMLDAAAPFADAICEEGDIATVWAAAVRRARLSAEATCDLVPLRGRARTHPGRSAGHPDPGAISFALIAEVVGRWFDNEEAGPCVL